MTGAFVGDIGVGLWTMQSSAARPSNFVAAYRHFSEDAQLVEQLGFHSIWTAEHRVWYDGWCPALLHAEAQAVQATETLRFGNAMLLAPQHDAVMLARSAATLHRLSGGRVDLGLGLGYRDAEFDALGLRRDRRGKIVDAALEVIDSEWGTDDRPAIWIGGMSKAAIARAARGGWGLVLPQSLFPDQVRRIKDDYLALTADPGPIGVLRDVWIEPDAGAADEIRRRLRTHYREEIGSWWLLGDGVGFERPDEVEQQLGRVDEAALVGSAETVAAGFRDLRAAGAELIVARVSFDIFSRAEVHEQLRRLAEAVGPLLGSAAATDAGGAGR
jgi:alkanesulfonate monooxygenase SsuD/methylene tetrahydromethanopterin reductase-like flavin-dependent oxidoreductase (luciferase family)